MLIESGPLARSGSVPTPYRDRRSFRLVSKGMAVFFLP